MMVLLSAIVIKLWRCSTLLQVLPRPIPVSRPLPCSSPPHRCVSPLPCSSPSLCLAPSRLFPRPNPGPRPRATNKGGGGETPPPPSPLQADHNIGRSMAPNVLPFSLHSPLTYICDPPHLHTWQAPHLSTGQ